MSFDPTQIFAHRYQSRDIIRHDAEVLRDPQASREEKHESGMRMCDLAGDLSQHFRHVVGKSRDITPETIRMEKLLSDIFHALNPRWVDKARDAGL